MTVTMKQIDEARGRVYDAEARTGALNTFRQVRAQVEPCEECGEQVSPPINSPLEGDIIHAKDRLREARAAVDALLREWWAQSCKEPLAEKFAEYEARVLSLIAERNALGIKLADAMTRCRNVCYANNLDAVPSNADWVDEVIGLLRVAREQRDRAEAEVRGLRKQVLPACPICNKRPACCGELCHSPECAPTPTCKDCFDFRATATGGKCLLYYAKRGPSDEGCPHFDQKDKA